jgi:hypothetical protein
LARLERNTEKYAKEGRTAALGRCGEDYEKSFSL